MPKMTPAPFYLLVLLLIAFAIPAVAAEPEQPGREKFVTVGRPVAGKYLVMLNREPAANFPAVVRELRESYPIEVRKQWPGLHGFSFHGSETAARALSRNPRVKVVEEAAILEISAVSTTAPWPVERIDDRTLNEDTDYEYCTTGSSQLLYVVDTGVRRDHQEFWNASQSSRVISITDDSNNQTGEYRADDPCGFIALGVDTSRCGSGDPNCTQGGHGTSVASAAAGKDYGVAKEALIVPVKVMSCDPGSMDDSEQLVGGLEWIFNYHSLYTSGVVNISVFYWSTHAEVQCPTNAPAESTPGAVMGAVDDLFHYRNLPVIVSANNFQMDARCTTPANVPAAITVGASNDDDKRADFSNWGPALDLFAPGVDFDGGLAHITGTSSLRPVSNDGTSFAAPLVAGVALRYLQVNPAASPNTVRSNIIAAATAKQVDAQNDSPDFHDSPDYLLYWNDCD